MKNFFSSLFWKISAIFLFILIVISGVYMYIAVFTAEMYFQETRQKLDIKIAEHIANDNDCFTEGKVNSKVLENVFHDVMIINPSIEVYLLDTTGKILSYFAPNEIIKIDKVPLGPIHRFIKSSEEEFLMHVDPKNPSKEKAFSAAEVIEEDQLQGYIYVILGSEEFENASELVFGSYILRLGVRSMMIALITAAIVGFIAIAIITRNIRKITHVIDDFRKGNLSARIKLKGKSELTEFANAFNEMADTIVENIEEIKSIDQSRRELIANVSHDLRTPLSIIQGYIETVLIKLDQLSEEEREHYLNTILSGTKRLLKLVEELFELSKLETKQIQPNLELFSIAELAQDIHQENLILAESKGINLKLDVEESLPLVKADISMMEKVFQNLLDNSMKSTPPNGTISIELNKMQDKINVTIKDTGTGISKEDLPYIFERYHKNQRISGGGEQGLGLGLAIVKKIIELHNSEITVTSSPENGTKFSFGVNLNKSKPLA